MKIRWLQSLGTFTVMDDKCTFREEAIMRYIMMDEDDISICEQTLNPEHFNYYQQNKSEVQEMVNQQSVGFWVRYIISLRSRLYRIGLTPRHDWRAVHAEETYITLLNLMSDTNTRRRANKINELMEDLRSFYRYNCYVTEWNIPPSLAWNFPDVKPSLDRLFGKAEDIPYEIAMKKTANLPKKYPLETSSVGIHFMYPILSDDDADDDDEDETESGEAALPLQSVNPAGKPSQAQRSVAGASRESDQAIQDGLRLCAYCNKAEPAPNTYKRCKLCVDEDSPDQKHYCNKDCQIKHWKKGHKYDH
ncbi:uncharacterized protein [Periplaneta americana]|uniref:uncharacterized protein isoform X4 n=1 Tax=Periplaneta americana TaxID=6978 RepID=UPI0037E87E81